MTRQDDAFLDTQSDDKIGSLPPPKRVHLGEPCVRPHRSRDRGGRASAARRIRPTTGIACSSIAFASKFFAVSGIPPPSSGVSAPSVTRGGAHLLGSRIVLCPCCAIRRSDGAALPRRVWPAGVFGWGCFAAESARLPLPRSVFVLAIEQVLAFTSIGITLLATVLAARACTHANFRRRILASIGSCSTSSSTGLRFIPSEALFARHREQPLFREWREDRFYYLVASLVQVTAVHLDVVALLSLRNTHWTAFRAAGWGLQPAGFLQLVEIMSVHPTSFRLGCIGFSHALCRSCGDFRCHSIMRNHGLDGRAPACLSSE